MSKLEVDAGSGIAAGRGRGVGGAAGGGVGEGRGAWAGEGVGVAVGGRVGVAVGKRVLVGPAAVVCLPDCPGVAAGVSPLHAARQHITRMTSQ